MPTLGGMDPLPPDFARQLAEVLKPGDEGAAAQVIEAAIRLDDERLGNFLAMLAERVRSSARPINRAELQAFFRASAKGERAAGP
jgi:hypothetical protein